MIPRLIQIQMYNLNWHDIYVSFYRFNTWNPFRLFIFSMLDSNSIIRETLSKLSRGSKAIETSKTPTKSFLSSKN